MLNDLPGGHSVSDVPESERQNLIGEAPEIINYVSSKRVRHDRNNVFVPAERKKHMFSFLTDFISIGE